VSDPIANGAADALRLLAAVKHELGLRCAVWAGAAPGLETGIALAGIALEEEGHARVLEGLVGDNTLRRDRIVTWDTWPEVDDADAHRKLPWPEAMAAWFVRDAEATGALRVLAQAGDTRLAQRAQRMVEDECVHATFAIGTLEALSACGPAAARRIHALVQRQRKATRMGRTLRVPLERFAATAALRTSALEAYEAHITAMLAEVERFRSVRI
jgi:ring-1,2-phenylacetyl-CoA epoxidase subunit PaaC